MNDKQFTSNLSEAKALQEDRTDATRNAKGLAWVVEEGAGAELWLDAVSVPVRWHQAISHCLQSPIKMK
jgi:hypothetical protein